MGDASAYVLIAQSIAIVVSAACVVATIVWNRIMIRRRATLDVLLSEQSDGFLLNMRGDYLAAVKRDDLASFAEAEKWGTPDSFFLYSILNRYDLTAAGIFEGIVDKRILKRYWRATIVRDWVRCKQCILRRREIRGDPELYSDFEKLARSWATTEELKFL